MENENNDNLSRRSFLKLGAMASVAIAAGGCATDSGKDASRTAVRGSGRMTMRQNPSTGDSVSVLGFGFMRIPTVNNQSAQQDDGDIDQEEVNRQVDYALEHGVNYFDTSPRYCRGLSEGALGIALSRHPRDSYFIATKLSNFEPEDMKRENSIAMFNNSLKELRTDYIDYYLLHAVGGGGMENLHQRYLDNGMLDFCKQMRSEGKIRNLGFSYHGDVEVFDNLLAMHDRGEVHWDFVQIQLNYINWEHAAQGDGITARYLYEELERRNIPAVIMEPLLGGALAKVPNTVLRKMAERRPDDSPAAWAFRFAAQPGVLTVLSGMTYMDHVRDNVATYSPLEPVTADEHAFLMEIANEITENQTVPCTACAYCMPCPYGIDIPGTFAHYNKCVNEDNVLHDTRDERYAEARRAFLVGYDRAVERLRQADHCVACGACLSKCPQQIQIPSQLERIATYTEKLRRNKA